MGCVLTSGLLEQQSGIRVSIIGIIFGIAAAFFYALYSIFSRVATDKNYHTYTVIFYSVLMASIALLPFADFPAIGSFVAAQPVANIGFILLHSLFTSVLPYILITLALLHAEAGKVSILASGGEPIAAAIFGIIFYSEVPSVLMTIGLVVVIAALTLLCYEKKPSGPADHGGPAGPGVSGKSTEPAELSEPGESGGPA